MRAQTQRKTTLAAIVGALLVPATPTVLAAELVTFEPGTPARAEDVNANFDSLDTAIETIELTPGPQGPSGPQGPVGPRGPAGPEGAPGAGVASASVSGDQLTFTLTDDTTLAPVTLPAAGSGTGPTAFVTASVDCSVDPAGGLIQSAIDNAAPQAIEVTISGICQESVEIRRDGIRLVGNQVGDGIDGSGANGPAILAEGADNLLLKNLTIRETDPNETALEAYASSVRLDGVTASAGTVAGLDNIVLFGDQSFLRLNDTSVSLTTNASAGRNDAILVIAGSSVLLESDEPGDSVTVESLGGFNGRAILIANSSGIRIEGDGHLLSNGGEVDNTSALLVSAGSAGFINATNTTFDGAVVVANGSAINILQGTIDGAALAVTNSSFIVPEGSCDGAVCTTTINDTTGFSVFVDSNSAFQAIGLRATGAFTLRDGADANLEEAYLDLLNVDGQGTIVDIAPGTTIETARCVDLRGVDPTTGAEIFRDLSPQGTSRIDLRPRPDSAFRNGVAIVDSQTQPVDGTNTCVFDENGPVF